MVHMQSNPKEPLTKATWSVPELSVLSATLRKTLPKKIDAYEFELAQDEVLWEPANNDRQRYFGIVLRGGVDILRDRRLIDVVGRHEPLGLSALLRQPHTAVARAAPSGGEPTRVLLVEADPFAGSRRGTIDPEIEHAFFRLIVRGSIAVIRRLNAFALMNPYHRFIEMLFVLADERNMVWHSQRRLAQLLGIDVAQISRFVKYLTEEKKVLRRPPGVRGISIVEPDRLRKLDEPNTQQLRPKQDEPDTKRLRPEQEATSSAGKTRDAGHGRARR